jgi:hypothetical protein
MTHPIHRIVGFECVAPYSLHLRFEDGVETVVDLADVLEGELYGPLRDPFLFSRVALDSEVGTVVWPNGADFDPPRLATAQRCLCGCGPAVEITDDRPHR